MQVVFGFLRCSSAAIFFAVKGKSIGDALAVFQIVLDRVQGWFILSLQNILLILQYFFTYTAQKMTLAIGLKNPKTNKGSLSDLEESIFAKTHLNFFWWLSPFNSIDSLFVMLPRKQSSLRSPRTALLPRSLFYHARSKYQFSNQPDSGKNSGEQVLLTTKIMFFLTFSCHIRSKILRRKQKVQIGKYCTSCRQKLVKNWSNFGVQ